MPKATNVLWYGNSYKKISEKIIITTETKALFSSLYTSIFVYLSYFSLYKLRE